MRGSSRPPGTTRRTRKKVQELIDELKKVRTGEQRGRERSSHPEFKVDEEKGVAVDLLDGKGQKLTRMVVGGEAQSKTLSSGNFIRFGDEEQVYEVDASLRNKVISYPEKVETKAFLEKTIFKLPNDKEALRVTLVRPDHNVLIEKRIIETPVEIKDEAKAAEKKDDEKKDDAGAGSIADTSKDEKKDKKPEVKKEEEYWVTSGTTNFKADKSKEYEAKNILEHPKELRAEDAAEKKDPKEYGLDQPQLKV